MANKKWYETFSAGDCVKDYATWNQMVTYIKKSACTDFTIYSTCTSTGQAFKFTQQGTESIMYGGTNTGEDLKIRANDADTYPYITLYGDAGISCSIDSGENFSIFEGTTNILFVNRDDDNTRIYGGNTSGNDLYIIGNSNQGNPWIHLFGGGSVEINVAPVGTFRIDIDETETFNFYANSIDIASDRAIYINDDETYIGHGAGDSITSGVGNTLLGHDAGNGVDDKDYCVLIGYEAGKNCDESYSIYIGYQAGINSDDSSERSIGIGKSTLLANSGYGNTAIGYEALTALTDGLGNTAIGDSVLAISTDGNYNTGVGRRALYNATGGENTAIGYYACTSIGAGTKNTAVGYNAGKEDASNIVAIGHSAGENNTQDNIVAIGYEALEENTGDYCTAVGYLALTANTANGGTAIGYETLKLNTSGLNNTAVGKQVGIALTTGDGNTAIGSAALQTLESGNYNTAIGHLAGQNAATDINGCVYIGYDAGSDNTTANALYINNSDSAYPLIYGEFDNDVVKFGNNSDQWNFAFDYDGDNSRIYGSTDGGSDLYLIGNTDGDAGEIHILDNGRTQLYWDTSTGFASFEYASGTNDFEIKSIQINSDIFIDPNGSGVVKFGTYAALSGETVAGYITIKDAGGTSRKLAVVA